jgi:hypothetical protein
MMLTGLSLVHLAYVAPIVPDFLKLIVNIAAVPFFIGYAAYFLVKGPTLVKGLCLFIIPAVHVLVFGGDPAKPGLEYDVALVEYGFMWLGLLVSKGFQFFRRKKESSSETA